MVDLVESNHLHHRLCLRLGWQWEVGDPVVCHNFVEWGYGYVLVETNLVGVELLATQLQHSQLLYSLIFG